MNEISDKHVRIHVVTTYLISNWGLGHGCAVAVEYSYFASEPWFSRKYCSVLCSNDFIEFLAQSNFRTFPLMMITSRIVRLNITCSMCL